MQDPISESYIRDFFGIPDGPEGDRELEDIRGKMIRLRFENGRDICTIDGDPDGMFFLEAGTAVVLDREGEQINLLREGQYFGEYAVLSGRKRLSTVRALGRTVVYKLNNEDLMQILSRHPGVYGDLMRKVYGQVSSKHAQIVALSRRRRGILYDPDNSIPMTPLRFSLQYGGLLILFVLAWFLVPDVSAATVFWIPLLLLIAYAVFTKRTLESLLAAGLLSALLLYRDGLGSGFTAALQDTMAAPDNVFTVLVMALTGGMVRLIEASGAVTALKKRTDRIVKSPRQLKLTAFGILLITAIDDSLNLTCSAASVRTAADEQKIPREDTALMMSFLPTVLCAFIPVSLWSIFVIGTVNAVSKENGVLLFCRAIPYNFYAIVAAAAMLLFCFGLLPRSGALKRAKERVASGGKLWPEGSESVLTEEEPEIWGKPRNLLLPILVLAVASVTVRTLLTGSFLFDSAFGLAAALLFTFILYCMQGLMSPEQFLEHLIDGVQDMILPIVLYLLTMCLSAMLETEAMAEFFQGTVRAFGSASVLIPAVLFLVSSLLTTALGSSWAMFVIGFPVALRFAAAAGLAPALCVGAVCAAGISGEKNCLFTGDHLSVGSAVGCDPQAVLKLRIPYSLIFSALSLGFYLLAGLLQQGVR